MKAQKLVLILWAIAVVNLNSYSQLSKSLSLSFESSIYKPKDYLGHLENSSILERFGFTNAIGGSYLLSKDKSTFSFGMHYQRAILNYTEGYIKTNGYTTVEHEREESYDIVAISFEYLYRIGQQNEINSFYLSLGLEASSAFHYQKRKEAHLSTQYDSSSSKPLFERPVVYINKDESKFRVNRYGLQQLFLRPRAGVIYSRKIDDSFTFTAGSHFILGSVINEESNPSYEVGDFRNWWSFSLRVGLRYNL